MTRLLLCALCCAWVAAASAQVHKWVDANGVTHYGERPPAQVKSKPVELREATPRQAGSTAAPAEASDLKARELEFKKRQVIRVEEETRSAQAKAQRDEACRRARINLANLRETNILFDRNDKGERVYLSDAQRDAIVAKREAEFKSDCS